jgi:hypothetical protein
VAFLAERPASEADFKEVQHLPGRACGDLSYMAFRLISLLFLNNPDTPPE